jgi:hypothetical protein
MNSLVNGIPLGGLHAELLYNRFRRSMPENQPNMARVYVTNSTSITSRTPNIRIVTTVDVLVVLPAPSVTVYVMVLLPGGSVTVSPGLYTSPGFVSMVTCKDH